MDEARRVGRQLDGAVRGLHGDQVAQMHAHLARGLRRDLHPRIPRHVGHRIGGLLQPRPIGAAPVVEAARGVDEQDVRAVALELRGARRDATGIGTEAHRRGRRLPPHSAAPQGSLPELREGSRGPLIASDLLPLLHQEVTERGPPERPLALLGAEGLPAHAQEDVAHALALHRLALDQHRTHRGLHEADHAVLGRVVSPRLERVQRRQHQPGPRGGLARPTGQRHHQRHLREGLHEAGLGRHRVHRVHVDQQEDVDLPARHGLGEGRHVRVRARLAERVAGPELHARPHRTHRHVEQVDGHEGIGGIRARGGRPASDHEARLGPGEVAGHPADRLRGHARCRRGALEVGGSHRRAEHRGVAAALDPLVDDHLEHRERELPLGAGRVPHPLVGIRRGQRLARLEVHEGAGVPLVEGVHAGEIRVVGHR